ncbi:hypothetical protein ZYGR_0P02130 [Zygosaccharomyces rouxii]|uniref:ZYRO0E05368p n=2 Tax=Zygosaccharomyces rouxii TaxID=4956 RepID=C5E4E8_ZYGRC|nr:uncharacterized protein ZYRO0E05368g [Zygosaccharomyces rouxii]KAH9198233.1 hypothetical protein LQ764DRAFT_155263 [Zygosaccharomyces rouxii]GAV49568.1 hypothetical protein ZYGR_0P02130 [Zygosaccharomyces rouxii]CAR30909.1 ZYRO0E05368p [Zygosaccharomyces rouxii]
MDLSTALNVISTLESQLKELETMSKDYESEMEQVIDKLRRDYVEKCDQWESQRTHVTELEIRVDELESENAFLSNKINFLEEENDRHLERNVLLEHELYDAKERLENVDHIDRKKKLKRDSESLQVSTSGSSLLVMPRSHSTSNSNAKLNTSQVISTTSQRAKP